MDSFVLVSVVFYQPSIVVHSTAIFSNNNTKTRFSLLRSAVLHPSVILLFLSHFASSVTFSSPLSRFNFSCHRLFKYENLPVPSLRLYSRSFFFLFLLSRKILKIEEKYVHVFISVPDAARYLCLPLLRPLSFDLADPFLSLSTDFSNKTKIHAFIFKPLSFYSPASAAIATFTPLSISSVPFHLPLFLPNFLAQLSTPPLPLSLSLSCTGNTVTLHYTNFQGT